jgi:glutaconate CoA-transferase subunit A
MVHDGDYLGIGGFGGVRIPTAILHEIVRQKRVNLGFAGHTSTHDFQILAAGQCLKKVDAAYVVGLEARGLSRVARKLFEEGKIQVSEWTNAALSWRLKAAVMGVPFLPARNMLGTDTFRYSGAKQTICPFTGKKLVLLPALYPDVCAIHVHRADVFGNAQIDGITVSDIDLAHASKRVIVTTERLVSTEYFRSDSARCSIPYYAVDAVIEVPYGSYPGNMPYEYFSDEDHLQEWLQAEKDADALRAFLDKNIYQCGHFNEYLELNGGLDKVKKLRAEEHLLTRE